MSITFLEKREKQKQIGLVLAILAATFIIWQFFSFISAQSEKKPALSQESFKPAKEVKIDFKILESSRLTGLQLFEKIKPFEIGKELEIGRENPFTNYVTTPETN